MKKIVLLLVFICSFVFLSGVNLHTDGPTYGHLTTDDYGIVTNLSTGNSAQHDWLAYGTSFCKLNNGAPLEVEGSLPGISIWDGIPADPGADGNGFFIPDRFENWTYNAATAYNVWHSIYEYHDAVNNIDLVGSTGYQLIDPHPVLGDTYLLWNIATQQTNIGNTAVQITPFRYYLIGAGCNRVLYSNYGTNPYHELDDYDGIDGTADDYVAAISPALPTKPFYLNFGYPITHYRLQTYIAPPGGLYEEIKNGAAGYNLTNQAIELFVQSEAANQYTDVTLQPNQSVLYWLYPKPIMFENSAANYPTSMDYERKIVQNANLNETLIFADTDASIKYTVLDYVGGNTKFEVIAVEIVGGMIQTPVNAPLANVSSIRYWEIFYDTRRDVNTTCDITFAYDPATDGIANENTLLLAYRTDYDQNWTQWANITRDPDNNTIKADGVNIGDAHWILASTGDNPLPVALSSFTATYENDAPLLEWTTQSETDNLGWNIYRSLDQNGFSENNFIQNNSDMIPGMGISTEPTEYSFIDEHPVIEGLTYFYWLQSISTTNELGLYGPVSLQIPIQGGTPHASLQTALDPNYPNPFNPSTMIKFSIESEEKGVLTIFNLKGQLLFSQGFESGEHNMEWNAEGLPSGIYFYRLKTSNTDSCRKMILMK